MESALTGFAKRWVANMKISILCTYSDHPVINNLRTWMVDISSRGHSPELVFDKADLQGGDILFLVFMRISTTPSLVIRIVLGS